MEIRKLASIANKLDSLGLTKEADVLDRYLNKVAAMVSSSITELDIKAIENQNNVYFVDKATGGWYEYRGYGSFLKNKGYSNILLVEGAFPTSFEMVTFLRGSPQGRILEFGKQITTSAHLRLDPNGKIFRKKDGTPVVDASAPTLPVYSVKLKDQTAATSAAGNGASSGGGRGSSGGGGGGASGGGSGKGTGGGDSWARYIATAKDPKTGKVNTELNTRVKQVWQSTNPANKEFSGFTSWYSQQKRNMIRLELTPKDFGQEQAIALIQMTGGSGKGWEKSEDALSSIYNNIVISQNPASFDPSSIGLGRSGAGYAADLKSYKPTAGRSADPAKALLRNQIAVPAEEDYAGRATSFKDNSEFEFEPGVEQQMAARRQKGQQAMSGTTYKPGTSDELKYKTKGLLGS